MHLGFAGLSWRRKLHAHLLRKLAGHQTRHCFFETPLDNGCFDEAATACLALNGQLLLGKIMARVLAAGMAFNTFQGVETQVGCIPCTHAVASSD